MKRRTLLALLGGGTLAGSLVVESGAFTEETASRLVSVAVAGDDDAYLTLEFPQNTVSFDCSTTVDVTIRNRTGQPFDELSIDFRADDPVSVDPSSKTIAAPSSPETIGVDVTVPDGKAGTASLYFDVTAIGASVAIEVKERVVELDYDCPTQTSSGN